MAEPMTKQRLEQYRKLKREIEYLSRRVDVRDGQHVSDSVRGSSPVFPYTEHTVVIKGYETTDMRILRRLHQRITRLENERDEIETFIDSVVDSQMRMVLTLRYIDGLTWDAVAWRIGGSNTEDSVRKACSRFLRGS